MKKLFAILLAMMLILLPVSALAFTGEVTPKELTTTPITLTARLVDYQEGPFGVVYSEPMKARMHIINERVAVLLVITVPEDYDVEDLSLIVVAEGMAIEPYTIPIASGQYILYGRLTAQSATLSVKIEDKRVKTSMGTVVAHGHVVTYTEGKYVVDNMLTIYLDGGGRGESMTVTKDGNEYTAAIINGAVGFVGDGGNVLSNNVYYPAMKKAFDSICKDLGLDLANVGNYVPASHFLALQADRGAKATVTVNPYISTITVPDVVVDPPKTGDASTLIGIVMVLIALIGGAVCGKRKRTV